MVLDQRAYRYAALLPYLRDLIDCFPAVLSLSIWIGFSWGCLYGLVEAIPLVYMNTYGWRIGAVGLAFLSVVIGAFLGWALNRFQEKAYKKHRRYSLDAVRRCGTD